MFETTVRALRLPGALLIVAGLMLFAEPASAQRIFSTFNSNFQGFSDNDQHTLALKSTGSISFSVTTTAQTTEIVVLLNVTCEIGTGDGTSARRVVVGLFVDGARMSGTGTSANTQTKVICGTTVSNSDLRVSVGVQSTKVVGPGTHTIEARVEGTGFQAAEFYGIDDLSLIVIAGQP